MNLQQAIKIIFKNNSAMSNHDILNLIKKLNIKDFKGVYMKDELKSIKVLETECGILNLDEQKNNGTHWTCWSIQNNKVMYIDTFGYSPPQEFKDYVKDFNTRHYNSFQIQEFGTPICGQLCVLVLWLIQNNYDLINVLLSLSTSIY